MERGAEGRLADGPGSASRVSPGPDGPDGRDPSDGPDGVELPVVDALRRTPTRATHSLHMPGHKQGRRLPPGAEVLGAGVWEADRSELGGFDYLHAPRGALARSQELTARLFGADRTFFLVNGSTVGNIAAVTALAGDGDVVLAPRASHRSLWSAVMVSGADVVAVPPAHHPRLQGWFGAPVTQAARLGDAAVAAGRRIAVVHVTNPSYFGLAPDVTAWRGLADRWGAALVVDEAHGTHLAFAEGLPSPGLACGADVVIQSAHKTAGALTQASWMHVRSGRVDPAAVAHVLGQLQSSSPSALLTASLDVARAHLERSGRAEIGAAVGRARAVRARLAAIPGVHVAGDDALLDGVVAAVDPTKLLVSATAAGLSGFELDRLLRAGADAPVVEPEFADDVRVVLSVTWADDDAVLDALVTAVARAVDRAGSQAVSQAVSRAVVRAGSRAGSQAVGRADDGAGPAWPIPERVLSIRAAGQRPSQTVALADAAGRVSADYLIPYPPGIPMVLPGERLDAGVLQVLARMRDAGAAVVGPFDPQGLSVRVIAH